MELLPRITHVCSAVKIPISCAVLRGSFLFQKMYTHIQHVETACSNSNSRSLEVGNLTLALGSVTLGGSW